MSLEAQRKGKRIEKIIEEIMANIFSKFDKTYKSTDLRTLKNHKPKKYEENSTKAYHNQITQNQS